MAYLRKRGRKWFATISVRGHKREMALPAEIESRKEAEIAARLVESKFLMASGAGSSARRKVRFSDAAERYKNERATEVHRDTLSGIGSRIETFIATIGDGAMDSYSAEDCREYIAIRRSNGANPTTLKKEVLMLTAIFERALESDYIDVNPWRKVRVPKEGPSKARALRPDELTALLDASPDHRRFRWLFLAMTGARPGHAEAMRVNWSDVDWERRILRIPCAQKGGGRKQASRYVPIPQILMDELEARRGSGPIFAHKNNWRRDLMVDCEAAGIDIIRPYDLRHTYGTMLAELQATPLAVRDLMGHSSVKTSEIYIHRTPDQAREIANALDGAVGKKSASAKIIDMKEEVG